LDCSEVRFAYESRSQCYKFVFLGDVHAGSADTDEGLVREVARRLEEPDTYWFDLGDRCEFINMRDRRFEVGGLADWITVGDMADLPAAQMEKYASWFGGVADKCIVGLCRNHEGTIRKWYERDVYRELNRKLGLYDEPRGFEVNGTRTPGFGGFVRMKFTRTFDNGKRGTTWTLTVFVHHGAGGGQLAGAKALRLERLPMAFDADVFAVGHTHTKLAVIKRRVGMSGHKRLKLMDRPVVLINVGAFMRSYVQNGADGYVVQRMFYPQGLGPVELWVWPDKREVRVFQ